MTHSKQLTFDPRSEGKKRFHGKRLLPLIFTQKIWTKNYRRVTGKKEKVAWDSYNFTGPTRTGNHGHEHWQQNVTVRISYEVRLWVKLSGLFKLFIIFKSSKCLSSLVVSFLSRWLYYYDLYYDYYWAIITI